MKPYFKCLLLAVACVALWKPTNAEAQSSGFKLCAKENQYCTVDGTAEVSFGTGSQMTTMTVTGGIVCSNAGFGADPARGLRKACFIRQNDGSGSGGNSGNGNGNGGNFGGGGSGWGWSFCAQEKQSCRLPYGNRRGFTVRFGTGGRYSNQVYPEGALVNCTVQNFSDPAYGLRKVCEFSAN